MPRKTKTETPTVEASKTKTRQANPDRIALIKCNRLVNFLLDNVPKEKLDIDPANTSTLTYIDLLVEADAALKNVSYKSLTDPQAEIESLTKQYENAILNKEIDTAFKVGEKLFELKKKIAKRNK